MAAAPVALVSFARTAVKTVSKDGRPALNVASAGLKRPPAGFLMSPLEALTASSPYGYRISPISGTAGDFHLGQDFAAPCGTRVYAADSGVVRAAGWHPWGGGNRVEIDHGNGLITTYNHLEAIGVETGESVDVGQVIARVGTTGWSTGCHLHFETILDGRHVDPQRWTLIPIQQLDQLEKLDMVDFGADRTALRPVNWALPAGDHHHHAVVGGEHELPIKPAQDPGYTASTFLQPPAPSGSGTAQSSTGTSTAAPSGGPAPGTTASAPTTAATGTTTAPAPTPSETTPVPATTETGTAPPPVQAPADTSPPPPETAGPVLPAPETADPVPTATATETAAEPPPSEPVVVPEVPVAVLTETTAGTGEEAPTP